MFSWVPQKPQSSAAKRKINSRISECPNLNVIFHCRSSMKTMKGCDFCSKFIWGGIVVCCCSAFAARSTTAPGWSHRWGHCSSAPDFPTKPQKSMHGSSSKVKPLHDNSWLLWGKCSAWEGALLSPACVCALSVQELQRWRGGSSVWAVLGTNPVQSTPRWALIRSALHLCFSKVLKRLQNKNKNLLCSDQRYVFPYKHPKPR